MPFHLSEWQERVKAVENEYKSVRIAVDQLMITVARNPTVLRSDARPQSLGDADKKLAGTYIVRLFATFESALRSYQRAQHKDSTLLNASTLIDTIGGRRGQGISEKVRKGRHRVREVRNFWAHESEETIEPMTVAQARAQLCVYLSWLWDQ